MPAIPSTALPMMRAQLHSISRREISLPNIFKWNVTGRMTQMRKQKAAPMIAEMTSKDGTRIASKTIVQVTPIRKTARKVLVRNVDWLKRFGLTVAARGSMQKRTSSVDMIGEQLTICQPKREMERNKGKDSKLSCRLGHLLQWEFSQGSNRYED